MYFVVSVRVYGPNVKNFVDAFLIECDSDVDARVDATNDCREKHALKSGTFVSTTILYKSVKRKRAHAFLEGFRAYRDQILGVPNAS